MIIDFLQYVAMRKAREAALVAEHEADLARRERLEHVLTDLLAELQAA
ncbi:MAG: hypothetical protein P4M13_11175 [Alphaproteobacteria bacterium]|nr:hypothetical protein [Alphaproteobacteria bacterium]